MQKGRFSRSRSSGFPETTATIRSSRRRHVARALKPHAVMWLHPSVASAEAERISPGAVSRWKRTNGKPGARSVLPSSVALPMACIFDSARE